MNGGLFRLLVLTVAFAATVKSFAAQTEVVSPEAKEQAAVLPHLDATIAWYHQLQSCDGWSIHSGDEFYRNNQRDLTIQVVTSAFSFARAVADTARDDGKATAKAAVASSKVQMLTEREARNADKLADLRNQLAASDAKIAAADAAERPKLTAQSDVIRAQIDLANALGVALDKTLALFSNAADETDGSSLGGKIAALRESVPEVFDSRGTLQEKKEAPKATLGINSDGIVNRAITLFSLLKYRHSLETFISKATKLSASTDALAAPLAAQLRAAIAQADNSGQQGVQSSDVDVLSKLRQTIEGATLRFKSLSGALIPLREEAMALEHSRANLGDWKAALTTETDAILRVLFLRAIGLLVVLALLFAISEVWRRATFKYVHDARRRRQFLLIRRFTTSVMMVVVIVLGFVSDFSSLATFAGFITAGIAVALQTVILSVAAYFFLIGRYGVRVGDRVTVSGVTGDVIDIGLVRVFLMELAGTGVDLHPTGRVVVLANSALFSNSPLYKQLPGTDYAWHEVFVTLAAEGDAQHACDALLNAVNTVYGEYRTSIERQHGALERLLDYKTEIPVPSGHIRLCDAGLEVVIRFPAEIRRMSEIDEVVSKEVLSVIRSDESLKNSLTAMPRIRSAVKS